MEVFDLLCLRKNSIPLFGDFMYLQHLSRWTKFVPLLVDFSKIHLFYNFSYMINSCLLIPTSNS